MRVEDTSSSIVRCDFGQEIDETVSTTKSLCVLGDDIHERDGDGDMLGNISRHCHHFPSKLSIIPHHKFIGMSMDSFDHFESAFNIPDQTCGGLIVSAFLPCKQDFTSLARFVHEDAAMLVIVLLINLLAPLATFHCADMFTDKVAVVTFHPIIVLLLLFLPLHILTFLTIMPGAKPILFVTSIAPADVILIHHVDKECLRSFRSTEMFLMRIIDEVEGELLGLGNIEFFSPYHLYDHVYFFQENGNFVFRILVHKSLKVVPGDLLLPTHLFLELLFPLVIYHIDNSYPSQTRGFVGSIFPESGILDHGQGVCGAIDMVFLLILVKRICPGMVFLDEYQQRRLRGESLPKSCPYPWTS